MSTERENPVVSVIIPNYNHARFLGDAIQSVLDQDYKNIEIIVVDDGSTDDSRDIAAQFGDKIQYIYQDNAGLSAARNTGMRAAKGAMIGVLDADDIYEPEYLSTLVAQLQSYPNADGIYCGYQFVDEENNLLPQIETRYVASDLLYDALLDGNFFVPESIFLRRYVYDDVGLFDETLRACEDWDVWLRVTKKYTIIYTPQILTRHRILAGSMSTDPLRMLTNRLAVLKKHVGDEPVDANDTNIDKRRAYGRAYLGSCVEYLQYGDQNHAYECFQNMANICPELLIEIDTYYQLGCGDQPKGSMGDLASLNVKRNSIPLEEMIKKLLGDAEIGQHVKQLERKMFSTTYFTLGMLAYGTREFREVRFFFWQAILNDPKLLFSKQLVSRWAKSFISPKLIDGLKNIRQGMAST